MTLIKIVIDGDYCDYDDDNDYTLMSHFALNYRRHYNSTVIRKSFFHGHL